MPSSNQDETAWCIRNFLQVQLLRSAVCDNLAVPLVLLYFLTQLAHVLGACAPPPLLYRTPHMFLQTVQATPGEGAHRSALALNLCIELFMAARFATLVLCKSQATRGKDHCGGIGRRRKAFYELLAMRLMRRTVFL